MNVLILKLREKYLAKCNFDMIQDYRGLLEEEYGLKKYILSSEFKNIAQNLPKLTDFSEYGLLEFMVDALLENQTKIFDEKLKDLDIKPKEDDLE